MLLIPDFTPSLTPYFFYHMGKTFEDNIPLQSSNIGKKIDSKLLRKLRQKRMAQGHKRGDYGQERTDL